VQIEKPGRIHTYTFPLLAIFLVPIFIFPRMADPFNLPKELALFVLAIGGITHFLLSAKQRFLGSVNLIIYGLILLIVAVSMLSDTTLSRVLFGLPGRSNGLIYYVSLLALLFVAKNCFISSRFENRILMAIQFPFLFNIIYALVQLAGRDPIPWANPYNPIIGTLGNPNFAASFLAASAIFYAFLCYKTHTAIRFFYLVCAGISLGLSALTESIQGILLFVIAIFVFLFIQIRFKSKRLASILFTSSFFVSSFLFFGFLGYGPLSMFREYTFALRLQYWIIAVKSAISSPMIGLGTDSYVEGFRLFRSKYLVNNYSVELLADSAHSVPLNIAANFGSIVFLLYCTLLLVISYVSVRRTLLNHGKFDVYSIFTVLWLALLIQSFISIEQIGLSTTQMIIGGFLLNEHWKSASSVLKSNEKNGGTASKSMGRQSDRYFREYKGELSFAAIAIAFIIVLPIFREDIALNEIKGATVTPEISDQEVEDQFERFSFYTKEEWNRGVWLYNFLLNSRRVQASNELLNEMINKDKSASEALDQLSKVHLSENRLSDARQTYLRILKLDPLNAKARIALAEVEKKLGNTMGSQVVLREVVRDLPNSPWAETATAMLNFR
jgi:hypothetical protein